MLTAFDISFVHLGITIEHISKSFSIGPISFAYYGLIIAIGMLAGIGMACMVAKKTGQGTNTYLDFALYGIIFGIIGARAYYVIFKWSYYSQNPLQILNLRGGGLAIYGGVIAAVITAFVYSKRHKLNIRLVMDTAIFGLITGQIIGRWGNFVNCEAFGQYTDGLFAMMLNTANVNAADITELMRENMVVLDGVQYIQVTPTFLYESCWNLCVLILMLLRLKHKKFDGEMILWYFVGYGCGRLWIEGLRTDQLKVPGTSIPVSQMLSVVLVIAAVTLLIIGFRSAKAKKAAVGTEDVAITTEIPKPAAETGEAAEGDKTADVDSSVSTQEKGE